MARKNASLKPKSISSLPEQTGTTSSKHSQFPIVGVGASAGGLEAFTQLFRNLPADPGMAFVLIQHLAPSHESMLTGLLSKSIAMPVREVEDGMAVEPNNVYVIPPDSEMSIFQEVLHLTPRGKTKGQYMPVDSFLRSLAEDRGNNAIAVIMSGTGSDGSMGIRAVKGEDGIVFAQDETAKYDGMPRSAIDTGCVDFVLPPDKIAAELLRIRRHPYLAAARHAETVQLIPAEKHDLSKIFIMLRSFKGVDFTSYKRSTIMRRVNRRMLMQKIEGIEEYVAYLKETPSEIETLYQDILINVTSFFREPEAFDALKRRVFPRIVKKAAPDIPVRIWVPACSTGEEAYSIAMSLIEYMDDNKISRPVQLFATDIDDIAVEKARKGLYSENATKDVSRERLTRFFEKTGTGYVINKFVREMCIFAKQNMVKDPPFSKIDLVSCRNVLIYFGPELQKKAVTILLYALSPKGFLMIGPSESVGEFGSLFSVVDKKYAIYARKADQSAPYFEAPSVGHGKEKSVPAQQAEGRSAAVSDIQTEADTIILTRYGPPGLVVSDAMKILQFRGDTGPYLKPAPGEASLNLLRMVSEDLVAELRTAIHQAKKEDVPVRKERCRLKHDERINYIDIDVVPFRAPASGERSFLVLFEKTGKSPVVGAGLKPAPDAKGRSEDEETVRLRQELSASKAHLKSVIEEFEAANEELRALNEELQSSNEEMQSINEELETTKEELQSTNEELTTVNDELQSRNEETTQLYNDLVNVLRGVEIPIVLLGSGLQLKRFNDAAAKMLNLIPSDVGRPLSNIRTNINIPDLEQMALDVISNPAMKEREVQDAEGRWYSLTIRPYKTIDNRIDGALMTLVDIDDIKSNLLRIEAAHDYANAIVETVREPLLVLAPDLRVITANRSFCEDFVVDPAEAEGRYIYELGNGQWNIPDLVKQLQEVLQENKSFSDLEVAIEFPNIGRRDMMLNARQIRKTVSDPATASLPAKEHDRMVLLAIEDITERKKAEQALHASLDRYRSYIEVTGGLGWTTNPHGQVVEDLPSWRSYTGQTPDEIKGLGWSKALHPGDLADTLQIWEKAVMGRSKYEAEYRIRRHDGTYRHFMVRGIPVLDEEGNIREWVGTCIDITERKKSEEALEMLNRELQVTASELKKRTEEALQESEGKFRSLSQQFQMLLEAITDPLTLLTPDLKVQWWNKAAGRMSGKRLSDPASHYCYSVLHNRSTPCEGCPAVKSFSTGTREASQWEFHGRHWELKTFPIRDEAGGVISVLTVASDITERMTLQAEAMSAAHLASLGELAAGVAHEINNPINGIINYAQILSDEAREAGRESGIPARIISEGNRIASIVRNLLSFARERKEEQVPVRTRDILSEALDLIGTQLRKDGIILRVDIPQELPDITVHPQQVQGVFLNLINNARYALNQKYPGLHKDKILEIRGDAVTADGRPYVKITFHDHGVGIPPRIRDKVIDPFFTTKPRGVGTGLGLSISHGIISDHGGKLTIDSVEGEFTKVQIVLPVAE